MKYRKNNIRIKINTKNISYPEAKKLVRNSVVTTYTNVAKPVNNPTQNQGMTHHQMINLIKELRILIELLRESLTNLTTNTHAEPDPKKNLQLQTNKTEDPKKQTQQKHKPNNRPQVSILSLPKTTNNRGQAPKKSSIAIIYVSTIRNLRLTLTHPQVFFLT